MKLDFSSSLEKGSKGDQAPATSAPQISRYPRQQPAHAPPSGCDLPAEACKLSATLYIVTMNNTSSGVQRQHGGACVKRPLKLKKLPSALQWLMQMLPAVRPLDVSQSLSQHELINLQKGALQTRKPPPLPPQPDDTPSQQIAGEPGCVPSNPCVIQYVHNHDRASICSVRYLATSGQMTAMQEQIQWHSACSRAACRARRAQAGPGL